jgi:hypothetical protein
VLFPGEGRKMPWHFTYGVDFNQSGIL